MMPNTKTKSPAKDRKMAKSKVNSSRIANNLTKTDRIRQALKGNPSPSEVAKELRAQGCKVSAQYVSTIKAADKRRAAVGGTPRKPGRPRMHTNPASPTSQSLLAAVDLILQAGGAEEAHACIDAANAIVTKVKG